MTHLLLLQCASKRSSVPDAVDDVIDAVTVVLFAVVVVVSSITVIHMHNTSLNGGMTP